MQTETDLIPIIEEGPVEEGLGSNETYSKLIKILEDMNINSRMILPQEVNPEQSPGKKYQELKDS